MKVAVLGAGGWGTALAVTLRRADQDVTLWVRTPEQLASMRVQGENRVYLPGVPLPVELGLTSDAAEALSGAELALVAVPTQFLRSAVGPMADLLRPDLPLVSLCKGLEAGTLLRPSQVLVQVLGERPVAVLSGPSHAEEVGRGQPALLVAASATPGLAERVQAMFGSTHLRIYTGDDPLGVELGGALKNVVALAAGMVDGLGAGHNAKAALLCRGLAEMARLGVALGARPETFAGLAGLGDLILTSYSPYGRNRAVGERMGRGESLSAILASMRQVAEGVATAPGVLELAARHRVDMPIVSGVVQVLSGQRSPADLARALMSREPRPETPLG